MQERDIRGEIEQELTKIEKQEQVRILLDRKSTRLNSSHS